jgi:hypothetical protein
MGGIPLLQKRATGQIQLESAVRAPRGGVRRPLLLVTMFFAPGH